MYPTARRLDRSLALRVARRTGWLAALLGAALVCACASGPSQSLPPRVNESTVAPAPPASAAKGKLPPSPSKSEVDQLFTAKLTELRESARELGQPLALYPDDLRAAVLEVARDPALIPRLADVAHDGGEGLEAAIAGEPAPVAAAARKLVTQPRLLELLESHLLVVGIVGALYEDDPTKVRALLDQRARELEANEATVVDDWKKRVAADPDTSAQLAAAVDAYQATTGEDGAEAAGASQSGATTVIYAEPSYAFTSYVYGHCDLYWSLCGGMYAHWAYWGDYYDDYWDDYWDERDEAREDWQNWMNENRDELQQRGEERRQQAEAKRDELRDQYGDRLEQPGNGGMGQAIADWKGKNAETLPADFLRDDGALDQRFKSYGEADRSFREQVRSGAAQPADRANAIRTRTAQPTAQLRPAGTAPPRATQIDRGSLSQSQRIDRAISNHNAAWNRSGLPSQTGARYGGGQRGSHGGARAGGGYGGRGGGGGARMGGGRGGRR